MGWKWNDKRQAYERMGLDAGTVEALVRLDVEKKWELVGLLEADQADAEKAAAVAETLEGKSFARGQAVALGVVIDGVRPHGPRP